jgi:hypothetical protein
MSNLPINAHIFELDEKKQTTYYEVRLEWIPRAGDLIKLHSYDDQVKGLLPEHYYEVVRVIHSIDDITEKNKAIPQSLDGMHFVNIYVKNSADPLFNNV